MRYFAAILLVFCLAFPAYAGDTKPSQFPIYPVSQTLNGAKALFLADKGPNGSLEKVRNLVVNGSVDIVISARECHITDRRGQYLKVWFEGLFPVSGWLHRSYVENARRALS